MRLLVKMGSKLMLACALTGWAAPSLAGDVTTRYGTVGVANNVLTYQGQPLQPQVRGNSGLLVSPGDVFALGDQDVVLVTDVGGTLCPAMFRVAMVGKSGIKVSSPFGNCGEAIQAKVVGDKLSLTQPSRQNPGATETWVLDPAAGSIQKTASVAGQVQPTPGGMPQAAAQAAGGGQLGGEWRGEFTCTSWGQTKKATYGISIGEADRGSFRAAVEMTPEGNAAATLRHPAKAFLTPDGRVNIDPNGNAIVAGPRPAALRGLFKAADGTISLEVPDERCTGAVHRVSEQPQMLRRIEEQRAWQDQWVAEMASVPWPSWTVGVVGSGSFSLPDCRSLAEWSTAFGRDDNFSPNWEAGQTVGRHFGDDITARVFGKAAYYWSDGEWAALRQAGDACSRELRKAKPGPEAEMPGIVTSQGSWSRDAFRRHQELVRQALTLASLPLAIGDEPSVALRRLKTVLTVAGMRKTLSERNGRFHSLPDADAQLLVDALAKFEPELVQQTVADATAQLASVPATVAGRRELDRRSNDLRSVLGGQLPQAYETALAARKAEIDGKLVEAEAGRIRATQPGLAELATARKAAADVEQLIGRAAPELSAALKDMSARTRRSVLDAELQQLAAVPETLDGIGAAQQRRGQLAGNLAEWTAMGGEDASAAAAYNTAYERRVSGIAMAVAKDLTGKLDQLPVHWNSLAETKRLAEQLSSKAPGTEAAKTVEVAAAKARERLLAAIAEDWTVNVAKTTPSAMETPMLVRDVKSLADKLRAEGADKAAQRLEVAAAGHAEAVVKKDLPAFKDKLKEVKQERLSLPALEQTVLKMEEGAKTVSALSGHVAAAREAKQAILRQVCEASLKTASIGSSDGRLPIQVGTEQKTVADFVCLVDGAGAQVSKFETPGMLSFGDKVYKMQVFNPGKQQLTNFSLKMAEPIPGQKMLVGVEIGDATSISPMTVEQWKEVSKGYADRGGALGGLGMAAYCTLFQQDPQAATKLLQAASGMEQTKNNSPYQGRSSEPAFGQVMSGMFSAFGCM